MKIRKLITTLLFLGGVILLAYPNVNVLLSNHDQTIAVKKYNDKALHYDKAMVKKEIDKGQHNRNDFYQTILSEISAFGGE